MLELESLGLAGLFFGSFLAATLVPFSSDVLYVGVLAATGQPLACFVCATAGNWLGGVLNYYLGRLGKWEWLEKYFHVKPETLDKQKRYVDKYGIWLALACWLPIVGDIFAIALGFYKTHPGWTLLLMLIGKALRFLVWTLLMGLF